MSRLFHRPAVVYDFISFDMTSGISSLLIFDGPLTSLSTSICLKVKHNSFGPHANFVRKRNKCAGSSTSFETLVRIPLPKLGMGLRTHFFSGVAVVFREVLGPTAKIGASEMNPSLEARSPCGIMNTSEFSRDLRK